MEKGGCSCGVMVKAMDCRIVVSEFVFQSRYYVHLWANTHGKDMNHLIVPAMSYIVPLLFFSENSFDIKLPIRVDVPLNKESKPNGEKVFFFNLICLMEYFYN